MQDRVPWFKLDEGFETWAQYASVLVKRSNHPLDHFHPNLYLIRSLEVPIYLSNNSTKVERDVDITDNDEIRKSMTPLFNDPIKYAEGYDDRWIEGTTIVFNKGTVCTEMDVKTMRIKKSTRTLRPKRKHSKSTDRDTAPSGVQVRVEHELEAYIEVIDENDNLLHVRVYLQYRHPISELEDFSWETCAERDLLVHKDSHAKDADGTVVVTPLKDKPAYSSKHSQRGLVNLLPGSGGALVTRECQGAIEESYLAYVEPKRGLPLVYLFSVPWLSNESCLHYSSSDIQFFVSYGGYFFFYFEGRFVRLWIDLGVTTPLDRRCLGEGNLMKYGTSRALVIWDRTFPTIGTFCEQTMEIVSHGICQSGPWVTVTDAVGECVGNLATGETIFAKSRCGRLFPYMAADTVKFGAFHGAALYEVVEEMRTGKETQFDFEQLRSSFPPRIKGGLAFDIEQPLDGDEKDAEQRYDEKKRKPGSEFQYLQKDYRFDDRVSPKQYIGDEHIDIYKKRTPPPLNSRTITDHGVFRGVVDRTPGQGGYCGGWDCAGHTRKRRVDYRRSHGRRGRTVFKEIPLDAPW